MNAPEAVLLEMLRSVRQQSAATAELLAQVEGWQQEQHRQLQDHAALEAVVLETLAAIAPAIAEEARRYIVPPPPTRPSLGPSIDTALREWARRKAFNRRYPQQAEAEAPHAATQGGAA